MFSLTALLFRITGVLLTLNTLIFDDVNYAICGVLWLIMAYLEEMRGKNE